MIKKRRQIHQGTGGDLADVNEQELAKTTEKDSHADIEKTGRDTSIGESLPENIVSDKNAENTETAKKDAEQLAITPLPDDELPVLLSENTPGEEECDAKEVQPDRSAQNADSDTPPCEREAARKKGRGAGGVYAAIVVLCLWASIAIVMYAMPEDGLPSVDTSDEQSEIDTDLQSAPIKVPTGSEDIYKNGVKSTVSVVCTKGGKSVYSTGFAVFEGGYIATLYEAVTDGNVEIVTWDGRMYPATVVGAEPSVNLALLRADYGDIPTVSCADKSSVMAGDDVFAIGNLGDIRYASSLLGAKISYADRQSRLMCPDGVQRMVNAIQLDSITQRSIGGCPIFNLNGEAVGIALSPFEGEEGSFAFSLAAVLPVLEHMRDGLPVSDTVLCGLAFAPAQLGIIGEQGEADGTVGVVIQGFSDSAADSAAKLREGDIIYRVGDSPVTNAASLRECIENCRPGDSVEVYVLRNAQKLSFYVTLGE